MFLLADALVYFNNVDDDEVQRLYEQSNAIFRRLEGSLSVNVAAGENNLAGAYQCSAKRAFAANDPDRAIANLEEALTHYREAVRINRAVNYDKDADDAARAIVDIEKILQQLRTAKAAATTDS